MQVCEIFLNKKWQSVMLHNECEQSKQSIHIPVGLQQPRGLGLGGKVLALALLRPRPRPSCGFLEDPWGQGQASRI